MTESVVDVEAKGHIAQITGQSRADCPYDDDPWHSAWQDGFTLGLAEEQAISEGRDVMPSGAWINMPAVAVIDGVHYSHLSADKLVASGGYAAPIKLVGGGGGGGAGSPLIKLAEPAVDFKITVDLENLTKGFDSFGQAITELATPIFESLKAFVEEVNQTLGSDAAYISHVSIQPSKDGEL